MDQKLQKNCKDCSETISPRAKPGFFPSLYIGPLEHFIMNNNSNYEALENRLQALEKALQGKQGENIENKPYDPGSR